MSLFGSLPPEARARRPVTEEEATDAELAAELADLPDDEGMLEELEPQVIEEPQLKRRRRDVSEEAEAPTQMQNESDMQDGKNKQTMGTAPISASQTVSRALPAVCESSEEKPLTKNEDKAAQALNSPDDQIAAALRKITSHIGNPSKFPKASPLLRQLLESGTLDKQHRTFVFDAIRAVFSLQPGRHKHLVDPMNRREVMKLTAAVENLAATGYFLKSERAQIEVYHLLGITCNEMQTDDSFMFSKVLAKLRAAVDQLPEISDETDKHVEAEAYAHVTNDKPGSSRPKLNSQPALTNTHTQQQTPHQTEQDAAPLGVQQTTQLSAASQGQQAISKEKTKKLEPTVDDPFGLDAILQPPTSGKTSSDDDPFGLGALMDSRTQQAPPPAKPKPAPPAEPDSTAWSAPELLAAKRCAVLVCVKHACTFHKHAWAQTGIELLAEHCWKSKTHFSPAQHAELDELWVWVRKARAARKVGPSAKEINRDSTSFERARAEWSKATVSARGKVGAQGDAKAANWLG